MKTLHLLAVSAAMAALPVSASTEARAQQAGLGPRTPPPPPHPGGGGHGGHHGFKGAVFIVEREPVIIEREVVREVPAEPAAPPAPPPEPREPYVVGKSYASLPRSCMKLIEGSASYYYCGGGEWYRAVGKQFLAVKR